MIEFHDDNMCPNCKQPLPQDMIDADRAKNEAEFNESKSKQIARNVIEGTAIKNSIIVTEGNITACKKTIADTEAKLSEIKSQVISQPDYETERNSFLLVKKYDELVKLITRLEKELQDLGPAKVADTSELQGEKSLKHVELDSLKKSLQTRDQIASGSKRIEELKAEQSKLSQELADFEKIEFTIAGFNKAKIEAVESKINSMFRFVHFKMYNQQVNGMEEETCECTVDGVPYSDLNSGMQINSGLDIISTLTKEYGISAPIFIDNAESINKLIPIDSQLIRLVVTTDKELVFN
jgi:vacuolar-type H+-ATPase subunit I/STV1